MTKVILEERGYNRWKNLFVKSKSVHQGAVTEIKVNKVPGGWVKRQ
ncbi:MAG: hypothetical protein AAF316_02890 [Cyanobacteria bacterium P01_A01_bin.80]